MPGPRSLSTALSLILLLGTGLLAIPRAAAETFKLTAAAGHHHVFPWVKLLTEFYIPEVNRRVEAGGRHRIDWSEAYGGTLVKLGQESDAIRDGIADIGFVSTIFEAGKLPLQNVSYMAPFGSDDIALVTRVTSELQQAIPAMNDAWAKHGLTYLGGAALDSYHLWTTFPVTSVDDLKGRKISAPGPSANWIRDTGAVAVAGSLQTYYNDIKTGAADGTLTFATGAWGAKVHEVAPYITKVNFGAMFAGGLAINKTLYDGLPPELRQVLREVADEYSQRLAKAQSDAAAGLLHQMAAAGAIVAELDPVERKRWAAGLPNLGKTWAADLDAKGLPGTEVLKGYMEGLKRADVDLPRNWSN